MRNFDIFVVKGKMVAELIFKSNSLPCGRKAK